MSTLHLFTRPFKAMVIRGNEQQNKRAVPFFYHLSSISPSAGAPMPIRRCAPLLEMCPASGLRPCSHLLGFSHCIHLPLRHLRAIISDLLGLRLSQAFGIWSSLRTTNEQKQCRSTRNRWRYTRNAESWTIASSGGNRDSVLYVESVGGNTSQLAICKSVTGDI
jgi:hypothetical protein